MWIYTLPQSKLISANVCMHNSNKQKNLHIALTTHLQRSSNRTDDHNKVNEKDEKWAAENAYEQKN